MRLWGLALKRYLTVLWHYETCTGGSLLSGSMLGCQSMGPQFDSWYTIHVYKELTCTKVILNSSIGHKTRTHNNWVLWRPSIVWHLFGDKHQNLMRFSSNICHWSKPMGTKIHLAETMPPYIKRKDKESVNTIRKHKTGTLSVFLQRKRQGTFSNRYIRASSCLQRCIKQLLETSRGNLIT